MKPVIIIVFFALFPGLTEAKLHHKKPTAEQMILTKINALYEVKEFMKYTPKAFKPVIIVYNEPTPQDNYWWVKVGISNFDMLRTNFNFRVDSKTFKIYYLDVMDGNTCMFINTENSSH